MFLVKIRIKVTLTWFFTAYHVSLTGKGKEPDRFFSAAWEVLTRLIKNINYT